ncbi:MAG: DUF1549 domain-containing protein, partial [Planctomycetales bacterium]|nr:DUF1549 domain-containing protein [Planctomycetales bacterium]
MCGSLRHFLSLAHLLLGMITWSLVAASVNGQESQVDFQRDVQPIFAEHCARCHGVDAETREGGLRLDMEASWLAGGDSGEPAIVPGKPDQSYLMARITSSDESEIMPPPDEKKPLSEQQIATLQKWIEAGAPFQDHWAFVRPERPAMEATDSHPIDSLVDATLSKKQMKRSPTAPDYILCRRLYLDLIGLPPSPEQWQAFQADGLPATVDKLLASPRFGEKWARHWLDVARYSDTNGYEKDLRREQWAWRDWVVTALNEDKPYNQFVIEQIAGDLLPNATQDNLIATGFLRNSMINEEGAIVPEQFRMVEMFDRMDCVGKAVLGLTTQCAQCHSHKFDPLTQEEYYGMFAYLNNSYEARSWVYNQQQQQKRADVFRQIQELEDQIKQAYPDWQTQVNQFAVQQAQHNAAWTTVRMHDMNSVSGLNHPVHNADDSILMLGHTSSDVYLIGKTDLEQVTGVRLEVLTHGDLPHLGPGRNDQGTWDILELEVLTRHPQEDGSWSDWEKHELTNATADWSQPEQKHEDGKKTSGPVSLLIDGTDNTWWAADRAIGRRNQPSVAVVQFAKPLTLPTGAEWKFVMRMGQMVGCCRISLTDTEAPCAQPVDYAAVLAAAVDAGSRTS